MSGMNDDYVENCIARSKVERSEEWTRWISEIPTIRFDSDWEVQITPPFGGAIARFRVSKGHNSISVYLDCYDKLGCFGEPYWEIYPRTYEDGQDVYRTKMQAIDDLLKNIRDELDNIPYDDKEA